MIRPATPADARAIAEVQVRAWWRAYADIVDPARLHEHDVESRERQWDELLAGGGSPTATLVAEVGARIAGFATTGPSRRAGAPAGEGELLAIYVDPPAQGAGVGTALLAAAEDALRDAGFTAAVLDVFEANGHARAFYAARGWAVEPGILLPDDWAPMVRYRRELAAATEPAG